MSVTTAEKRYEVSIAFDGYSPFGKTFGTINEVRGVNQEKVKEALRLGAQCMRDVGLTPMIHDPAKPGPTVSPVTGLKLTPITGGDVLFASTSAETAEGFAFDLRCRCAELGLPLTVGWGWVEGERETVPYPELAEAKTD